MKHSVSSFADGVQRPHSTLVVATHSQEGDKVERTIESWIFHHADFIDFDIAKVLGRRAQPVRDRDPA